MEPATLKNMKNMVKLLKDKIKLLLTGLISQD